MGFFLSRFVHVYCSLFWGQKVVAVVAEKEAKFSSNSFAFSRHRISFVCKMVGCSSMYMGFSMLPLLPEKHWNLYERERHMNAIHFNEFGRNWIFSHSHCSFVRRVHVYVRSYKYLFQWLYNFFPSSMAGALEWAILRNETHVTNELFFPFNSHVFRYEFFWHLKQYLMSPIHPIAM